MNYSVGGTWTAMSVLTGIPIGTEVSARNIGRAGDIVEVLLSDTQPSESDRGEPLCQLASIYKIYGSDKEIWLRFISYSEKDMIITGDKTCLVWITDADTVTDSSSIPSDLLTTSNVEARRLAVDCERTSFATNSQFVFFDRLSSVLAASTIAYQLVTTNPVNILKIGLTSISGNRELLIYPDSATLITTTGTFLDEGRLTPLNSNVTGGAVLPTTKMLVKRAIGAGIVVVDPLWKPLAGIIASASGNDESTAYFPSSDGFKLGLDAGSTTWLLLSGLSGLADVDASLTITYEELF